MYALFPPEYTRYLEVFGGSASVLLGKPPDKFEAFNDFNSDLINLFRCIQKRPMGLIYELKQPRRPHERISVSCSSSSAWIKP